MITPAAVNRAHEERLMVADAPSLEDGTVEPDGALVQDRCAAVARVPATLFEFVDAVARLLGEHRGQPGLASAEKVEGEPGESSPTVNV